MNNLMSGQNSFLGSLQELLGQNGLTTQNQSTDPLQLLQLLRSGAVGGRLQQMAPQGGAGLNASFGNGKFRGSVNLDIMKLIDLLGGGNPGTLGNGPEVAPPVTFDPVLYQQGNSY